MSENSQADRDGGPSQHSVEIGVTIFTALFAVIVIAGVNDIYQGLPAGRVTANLRTMYDRAAHAGIRVVAGTIVPYNTATDDANARMREVNEWIRSQERSEPPVAVADTRMAVAKPGDPNRLDDSPDGLHPSASGYRRMAVISAIGTQAYYARLGFELDGLYMTSALH